MDLYCEINSWKPVIAKKSSESSSVWGTHVDDQGNAVITYAKSKNKIGSLAHELLHFKMQKSGYRRMRCSLTTLNPQAIQHLVGCLDNELQHHRMFKNFVDLGFKKSNFYNDEDSNVSEYLEEILINFNGDVAEIIPHYFTLVAPGGSLTLDKKRAFYTKFRDIFPGQSVFDEIDEILLEWVQQPDLDHENTVRKIISSIPGAHSTWVGYDDGSGFPSSGFFIGKTTAVP